MPAHPPRIQYHPRQSLFKPATLATLFPLTIAQIDEEGRTDGYIFQNAKQLQAYIADASHSTLMKKKWAQIPQALKDDPKFMYELGLMNGLVLEFASERFKNDRRFVLNCVSQNGEVVQFASDTLKQDVDVAVIAVCNASFATTFLDWELMAEHEIFQQLEKNPEPDKRVAICQEYINRLMPKSVHTSPDVSQDEGQPGAWADYYQGEQVLEPHYSRM